MKAEQIAAQRFGAYVRRLWILLLLVAIALATQANAATIFFQDFESGLGANESTSGAFQINNTNAQNNGTFMMGHPATYGNGEYSFYQLQLNLAGVSAPLMQFDYRGSFETHFDRFNVLASTGAVSPPAGLLNPLLASDMQFIDLGDVHDPNLGRFAYDTTTASGGNSGIARFDLVSFAGQVVNLRFQFGSDGSVVAPGFVMDNLLVTGATGRTSVPEPSSLALLGLAAAALGFGRRRKKM